MFFAYVLKSTTADAYYKGHCQNLQKRIIEHNNGMTKSIKHLIPFKLVYYEVFDTRVEAYNREKYFKTSAGRKFLKLKIVEPSF